MLVLPAWAMGYQIFIQAVGSEESWIEQGRWLLVGIGGASLLLEVWMIIESVSAWKEGYKKENGADEQNTGRD
jgi:carbon starvation protein